MAKTIEERRAYHRVKMAEWRAAHPDHRRRSYGERNPTPGQIRRWNLAKYKMTPEQFDAMWEAQGRVCLACGLEPKGKRGPSVDHCHTTGRIRGLLCLHCNTALGLLKESPERMRALIAYVERQTLDKALET